MLAILEKEGWYNGLFVQKKPGEIKNSLLMLFFMFAAVAAVGWGSLASFLSGNHRLFSCPPSFSMVAKSIWVFCMYTFMNAICVTFLDGNNVVYMICAFRTKEQQAKVTAFSSFFTMAAAMVFNVLFPATMEKAGTSPASWSRLIGILAVPLAFVGILRMLTIKEQYNNEEDTSHEKIHIKDIIGFRFFLQELLSIHVRTV